MNALEIKGLKKSFLSNFFIRRDIVLKDVNVTVNQGEIYGFLGPNGAGKTTTIKCILGLITPDEGQISILDFSNRSVKGRSQIGYLPEQPYFYDYLTGWELLFFSGQLFSMSCVQISEQIKRLFPMVGLSGKEKVRLKKYSKGMLQRIGLAQSLINDPQLLILDEPFSGLDPIGRKELRDLIMLLKHEGKTIFFSSHILQDMELMVDKVGIILQGHMIKEGKLVDLISESVKSFEIVFHHVDINLLKANGLSYMIRDDKFVSKVEDENQVNQMIHFIQQNHGQVISIIPEKMNLEDIFLREIRA